MKELWNDFWNKRTFASRVLRGVAMGVALYLLAPADFPGWVISLLGGGAMMIPAGEKNERPEPKLEVVEPLDAA